MRGNLRRRSVEEEEESVFVSMTDMTVSFLFIVMILLAFFASQISLAKDDEQEMVPKTRHLDIVQQRNAMRSQIADFNREIERLRTLLQSLRAEAEESKGRIAALTSENEALRGEIAVLFEKIRKHEEELDQERLARRAAEQQIGRLLVEIQELESEIARLQELARDPLE